MTTTTHSPSAYGREEPFWEAALLRRFTPLTPDVGLGDYVHHYEQPGYPGQRLSTQFRELMSRVIEIAPVAVREVPRWRSPAAAMKIPRVAVNGICRLSSSGASPPSHESRGGGGAGGGGWPGGGG